MTRSKSELERRDAYARRYAALLAAEGFARVTTGIYKASSVTIEAEDEGEMWDDIVHRVADAGGAESETRFQVKRQQTDLPKDALGKLIGAAASSGAQALCFVFPRPVEIKDVGTTRILDELLLRLSQPGANLHKVASGLRDNERNWVDFIKGAAACDEEAAFNLLTRLRIDHVGLEVDIDRRALNALAPLYGPNTAAAWEQFRLQTRDVDGVVEVLASLPPAGLPPMARGASHALYAEIIREVEDTFAFDQWHNLIDHLVRCLVPLWFVENGRRLTHTALTVGWPGTSPGFEAAFKNLAKRTEDYLGHFETRSEVRHNSLGENKDWKRIFPNPRYNEECELSNLWDQGCIDRLNNLVVALNEYLRAVRDTQDANYRLRMGVLAVYDDLGVRGDGLTSTYWIPTEYVDPR